MKKIISASLIMLLMSTFAFSQKDKEKEKKENAKDDEKISSKLLNLYAMDKFEKCIEAADSYIKNDNTARSPYPYLYTSMCYLGIYNDQENFDVKKFKDPLRKALGFLGRFKKKDK